VVDPAPLDDLARSLFEQALLRGSFELRSGAVSDRYFDKYRATTEPRLLRALAGGLARLAREHCPEAVAIVAPALGAVPLAAGMSLELDLPFSIVRSDAKSYGTAQRIEGTVLAGQPALLIEDVITSGGAALEALEVARAAGIHVSCVLCVLDRDGGGREALAGVGATLHALVDRTAMDLAFAQGLGTNA